MIPRALLNYQKLTRVRKEPKRKDNSSFGLSFDKTGRRNNYKSVTLRLVPLAFETTNRLKSDAVSLHTYQLGRDLSESFSSDLSRKSGFFIEGIVT